MKRFWLLGIFIIFILDIVGFCIFASRTIDLDKQNNLSAAKILYKTAVNSKPDKEVVSPEDVRAVFVDLNGDGVDEVVGYIKSELYTGIAGTTLFVLQRGGYNFDYRNICRYSNFYPDKNLVILRSKENGYRDIQFWSLFIQNDGLFEDRKFILKYNGNVYQNEIQLQQNLKKYLG